MTTATTSWKGWRHIVGKVYATVVIENAFDAHDARVGRIPPASVRRIVIEQMMADTGASHPFLPLDLIERLGLEPVRTVQVETAAGISDVRVFDGARFTLRDPDGIDRIDTYSVIELPGGSEPLLGLTVMEGLGITPDVVNHRLIFLPETAESSHYTAYRA
jgi:predicted aspartyl protease